MTGGARRLWPCLLLCLAPALCVQAAATARLDWLTLRDQAVERQQLDYSCGAAALATLLQVLLAVPVSEASLLAVHYERVGHPLDATTAGSSGRGRDSASWYLSLADLSALAQGFGIDALALAVTPQRLADLRVPAIAYLVDGGQPHFVVLRGASLNGDRFALADPAWGNRSVRHADFLRQWLQGSEGEGPPTRGILLLLRPRSATEMARLTAYVQPPLVNSGQYLAVGQALR